MGVSAGLFTGKRPPRKVFQITTAGTSELKRWLATFHQPDPSRIPWLIQVFFVGQIEDDKIIAVLQAKWANLQQCLDRIRGAC